MLALLDRGLQQGRRVILVSASAGAGKTTLLGHWLATRRVQAAWLSLEQEDDEPTRFWVAVLHALQRADPGLGQWALEALASPSPPPLASLLPGLLSEIGRRHEPLFLVLDDYHLLTAKAIHESMEAVAQHLPERLRLVLCTRADPPLPLARWRASDELVEVRADDLRFTVDEALAFLNQRMALKLRVEDAEQLVSRTEGWAVGLQLAGLSLQGQADPHRALQTLAGSRHFVLEYLLEEVLAHQPAATQRFLLRTALLNRMCGPLCDAVTGEPGGSDTLLDLQRQNLFVVPLDEERCWYRYHHLFAELLRARLQQIAPQQVKIVHAAASHWYAENGMFAEALHHALAGQDWARAAELLEAREHDWWTGSDMAIMKLIPHLPDEVILRGPHLSVYKAWFLLIGGQLQAATALLNRIEHAYGSAVQSEDERGLLNFVAMQQAYIAEITERPMVRRVDASSLAHVSESRGGMRNSAEVILAYVLYRSGDFAEAARMLQMTLERDLRTGATNGIPIACSRLARMWLIEGRLQDAAELCRKSLSVIEQRGKWRFYVGGNVSLVLGDALREWDRLDEAEANIRTGIQDNAPWGIAHAAALGYTALARLLLSRRDIAGAAAALAQQAELTAGRTIPPDQASETRAAQMRIWLATGEKAQAARWAEAWSARAEAPPDFRNEQDQLTLARAWLALGKAQEAAALLTRLQAGTTRDQRARRFAEILMLLANAYAALGNSQRAVEAMAQSLLLAAPMGCIRMYLDEPPETLALVSTVGGQHDIPPAVAQFVRRLALQPFGDRQLPASPASPATPLVEALTPREQAVLGLLNAGLSNQEIADRLVITLHSVKKHTGNIYGKLGVTSRTQAIIKARDRGLLPVH